MRRALYLLVGGTIGLWLVAVYPASQWWGRSAITLSGTAALLCLIPALGTLVWSLKAFQKAPEQQLLALFGGMGLRIIVVMGGGLALYLGVPEFHYRRFWLWLIAFYLATLALEIGALVGRPAAKNGPRND